LNKGPLSTKRFDWFIPKEDVTVAGKRLQWADSCRSLQLLGHRVNLRKAVIHGAEGTGAHAAPVTNVGNAQIENLAKFGGRPAGDIHRVCSRRSASSPYLPFVHYTFK